MYHEVHEVHEVREFMSRSFCVTEEMTLLLSRVLQFYGHDLYNIMLYESTKDYERPIEFIRMHL